MLQLSREEIEAIKELKDIRIQEVKISRRFQNSIDRIIFLRLHER